MKPYRSRICIYVILISVMITGCHNKFNSTKDIVPEAKTYALITKSQGNPYNELEAKGFQNVIENQGGNCIVVNPERATVEEQNAIIYSLIAQKVDSIAIAANDSDALQSALTEAMDAGIKVSAIDSNTNPASRMTFVNQVSTNTIGEVLMEAVYDITGGKGQWAILSTTNQATNQNTWINAMKAVMEKKTYSDLSLVNIVYGQDEMDASMEMTEQLLKDYPELKVICAPTTVGMKAAAKVLQSMGAETKVKVTGLGLPSEMASYITGGEDAVCPYMYLWNPYDVGRLSAYVSIALVEGKITGAVGDKFTAGDMGEYELSPCEGGGSEVIEAPPLKFDVNNINRWKNLF